MQGPEIYDKLNEADHDQVNEIIDDIKERFAKRGPDDFQYNLNVDENRTIPNRVWKAVESRLQSMGIHAALQGAILSVRKPDEYDDLTEADLDNVKDTIAQIEEQFKRGSDDFNYDLNEDANRQISHRAWVEIVRRVNQAGYWADLLGAVVRIRLR